MNETRIYGVYDILRAEQCVLTGTAEKVVHFLSLNARTFKTALEKRKLVKNRYEIVYLYTE